MTEHRHEKQKNERKKKKKKKKKRGFFLSSLAWPKVGSLLFRLVPSQRAKRVWTEQENEQVTL
jgi:hypothetical protein